MKGAALLLLALAACSAPPSVDEVRASRNDSFCAHYPLTLDNARELLRTVFRAERATQVWEFADEGFLYASFHEGAAGAWTRVHDDGVIVTVTTRGSMILTKEEIHRQFVKAIEMVSKEKP